jgi:hypothetical protein
MRLENRLLVEFVLFGEARPLLRAAFFAWSAAFGQLKKVENHCGRLILCVRRSGNVDHLLLHCKRTNAL